MSSLFKYLRDRRWLSIIVMFFLIILAGVLRDRRFYYVNWRVKFLDGSYHVDVPQGTLEDWILDMDLNELTWLKWVLTLIYVIIFFFIAHIGIQLFSDTPKALNKVLERIYVVGILLALFLFGIDYLVNFNEIGYKSSRFIMHVLQSPLPLFMLIPAQFLLKK